MKIIDLDRIESVVEAIKNKIIVPIASTIVPKANSGSGSIGSSSQFARADHVHPDSGGSSIPNPLPTDMGGTGNADGYIRTGQKSGTSVGNYATIEGHDNEASGNYSHVEGYRNNASGSSSHAEGIDTISSGEGSHAEGVLTKSFGEASHAEGYQTSAKGKYSHSEGFNCTAEGEYSHVAGVDSIAKGNGSFAMGDNSKSNGHFSAAIGSGLIAANRSQIVLGQYNREMNAGGELLINTEALLIVGRGGAGNSRANSFRVGQSSVWGGTYRSSGADYAEMFEWEDGNPNNEDRVGRFVTLVKNKISYATTEGIILGITSAAPSVCGDTYDDQWQGMFETDIFGRPIYEDVTVPAVEDDEGNIIIPEHTERRQKLNPQYRSTEDYQGRSKRKEWTPVGIVGKLVMLQDGTFTEPGQYVKPSTNGVGTLSNTKTNCITMQVLDSEHIQVFIIPSFGQ